MKVEAVNTAVVKERMSIVGKAKENISKVILIKKDLESKNPA